MDYNRKNKFALLMAFVFIFFSSATCAVGLGKIKVYSYLNELLSAEIDLIGVENIDTDLLIANLASSKDFVRANMARPYFLTKLSFEVIRYEERTVIYIASSKPVKNPFLDFLVELAWPDGKLVKGYTILIDPPPTGNQLLSRAKPLQKQKASITTGSNFDIPASFEITPVAPTPLSAKPEPALPTQQQQGTSKSASTQPAVATAPNLAPVNNPAAVPQLPGKDVSNTLAPEHAIAPQQTQVNNPTQPAPQTSNTVPDNASSIKAVQLDNPAKPTQQAEAPQISAVSQPRSAANDNAAVAGALSDNIELNKEDEDKSLLSTIIAELKKKPLFSKNPIKVNIKEGMSPAKPNNTTPQSSSATLEELLKKNKQVPTPDTSSANDPTFTQAKVTTQDSANAAQPNKNEKNSAMVEYKADPVADHKLDNPIAADNSKAQKQSVYQKYGSQLILSFFMVLVSVIFGLKILRRSHATIAEEDSHNIAHTPHESANAATKIADNALKATADPFNLENYEEDLASLDEELHIAGYNKDGPAEIGDFDDLDLTEFDEHDMHLTTSLDAAIANKANRANYNFAKQTAIANKTARPGAKPAPVDLLSQHIGLDEFDLHFADPADQAMQGDSRQQAQSMKLSADHLQEVKLKINLAKQYIEAGDSASAKSVLDEIVAIADPNQKQEIDQLLRSIVDSKAVG